MKCRYLWSVLTCVVSTAVLAAPTLEKTFQQDMDYLTAVQAVAYAQDALKKVSVDAGTAVITRTQAEQGLAEAQARLALAALVAKGRVIDAWCTAQVNRRHLTLGEAKLQVAQLKLQQTQARQAPNEASTQEMEWAKLTCTQAQSTLESAKRDLVDAEHMLQHYGNISLDTLGEPPVVDTATLTVTRHPDLIAVQYRVKAAELAVTLSEGPDTAPIDRVATQRELLTMQQALKNKQRDLEHHFEATKRRYLNAQINDKIARSKLQVTEKDVQLIRTPPGEAKRSLLEVAEAEIAMQEALCTSAEARSELWQAYHALLQATGGTL